MSEIQNRLTALRVYGEVNPGPPPTPRPSNRSQTWVGRTALLVACLVVVLGALATRSSERVGTDASTESSSQQSATPPTWVDTPEGWRLDVVMMDGTQLDVTLPHTITPDALTISTYTAVSFGGCCTSSLRAALAPSHEPPGGEPSETFTTKSARVARFFEEGKPPALWFDEGPWTVRASVQGFEAPTQEPQRRQLAEGLLSSIVDGWPTIVGDASMTMSSGEGDGQPSIVLSADSLAITIMLSPCFDADTRGIEQMGEEFTGVRCFEGGLRATYQGPREHVEALDNGLDVRLRS